MTTMLVIDTTSRAISMGTANVSRSQTGLVVRPGLELPGLAFFAAGADWRSAKTSGGLPVLLIGDGYAARSSAGFVSVTGAVFRYRAHPIVGWLGDRGLRVIRPRVARLLGPVRIVADKTATNSNGSTASAVLDGLPLLAAADHRAVILAEGQSDVARVWRLLPADPAAEWIPPFEVGDLEEEFRSEMFAPEAVAQRLFRAAYRAYVRRQVAGPVGCARESLRKSAERIPEIRFALDRLNRSEGDFALGRVRLTTWEQAVLASEPADAVWKSVWAEGYPHVPLTMAQAARLAELDKLESVSEEFEALQRADARELDLPIEEWEIPLLEGKAVNS